MLGDLALFGLGAIGVSLVFGAFLFGFRFGWVRRRRIERRYRDHYQYGQMARVERNPSSDITNAETLPFDGSGAVA